MRIHITNNYTLINTKTQETIKAQGKTKAAVCLELGLKDRDYKVKSVDKVMAFDPNLWVVRFEGPCESSDEYVGTYDECIAYAKAIEDIDELSIEETYIITNDDKTIYIDDII